MVVALLALLQERTLIEFETPADRIAAHFMDVDGDGHGDLLIVTGDGTRRRIQLHPMAADGTLPAAPSRTLDVPPEAAALIFGEHTAAPGMEVCFLARDGVYLLPLDGSPAAKLIHARTFFQKPSATALPIWSYGTDLDQNNLWDFVLPTPDGYVLYLQTEPGVYGRIVRLEAAVGAERALDRALRPESAVRIEPMQPSALTVRRSLPRLFEADIDSDGRRDLTAFRGDRLHYYFQTPDGAFPTDASVTERVRSLRTTRGTDLDVVSSAQFGDIDGDGNVDLIVGKVRGAMDDVRSFITIHFGSGYGIFREDYEFELGGVTGAPGFLDVDGDGRLDVVAGVTRADKFGKILEAVFGDVEIDYKIYQYRPDARGFDRLSYQETLAVRKSAFNLGASERLEFRTDWDGDGVVDKIHIRPDGSLNVHPGRLNDEKKIYFTARSESYDLGRVPNFVYYGDFNADRAMDVLIFEPKRTAMLLSGR